MTLSTLARKLLSVARGLEVSTGSRGCSAETADSAGASTSDPSRSNRQTERRTYWGRAIVTLEVSSRSVVVVDRGIQPACHDSRVYSRQRSHAATGQGQTARWRRRNQTRLSEPSSFSAYCACCRSPAGSRPASSTMPTRIRCPCGHRVHRVREYRGPVRPQ